MPKFLSHQDREAFSLRLASYLHENDIHHCVIIFHGGEPLLIGAAELVNFATQLRKSVGGDVQLDIGLQTNGLLLTQKAIDQLASANIGISLSLDGPKAANDLHRTSRYGRSSFDKAYRALQLLRNKPDVFSGVIAVIDPRVPPNDLLQFFSDQQVPQVDFLLPDAHHLRPPPMRLEQPNIYKQWLIEAFDLWFDKYPSLQVRTFDALLDAVVGMPSQTDAFGFGDVSLITIETDGTYHDLDVLKVVSHGATRLNGSVKDTPISDVTTSVALTTHRSLLKKSGLCASCRNCDVVDLCGGGSLPHRYGSNGFMNPTVYCEEMKSLIHHVQDRITNSIEQEKQVEKSVLYDYHCDFKAFESAETSAEIIKSLWENAILEQSTELQRALLLFDSTNSSVDACTGARALLESPVAINTLAQRPGSIAWSSAMLAIASGRPIRAVDGSPLSWDDKYVHWMMSNVQDSPEESPEIHTCDSWLRRPFGRSIHFENQDILFTIKPLLNDALDILHAWRPAIARELREICRAIQFIRDPVADPDKIVSFSDNAVPGALYVSVMQGNSLIDAYDLADSLLHEYRHQKLYLLERLSPMVQPTNIKVISPWREDLRPPSGLFHAVFVFVELRRFWKHVYHSGPERLKTRAENQLMDTDARLSQAFHTLAECPLTAAGRSLVALLRAGSRG